MKNSVILLPKFHVRCQEVVKLSLKLSLTLSLTVKVSMKFHDFLTPHVKSRQDDTVYQKADSGISKISIFPRAIRYDTTYRYSIDISIFSIYRSITNSCCCCCCFRAYVVVIIIMSPVDHVSRSDRLASDNDSLLHSTYVRSNFSNV